LHSHLRLGFSREVYFLGLQEYEYNEITSYNMTHLTKQRKLEALHGIYNMNRIIYPVLLHLMSIIVLFIISNIIRLLLGWYGLGYVSYCSPIYY
jgi:hypothetical protein